MIVYIGMFLIAFSTLALEITLVRLLSVVTWYHLAFFSISTAMLGMTAGAVKVYLKRDVFGGEKKAREVTKACLYFSAAIPLTLALLCILPLGLYKSVLSPITILIATVACSLPFYFSGIVITTLLTKYSLPIGKLYATDLTGASLGCLFVLGGLEVFDGPSLILLCSAIGALSGICFALHSSSRRLARVSLGLVVLFFVIAVINARTPYGIHPIHVKGKLEKQGLEDNRIYEKWNSFSRILVYKQTNGAPQYWGASPLAPNTGIPQHGMNIDGMAATTMCRFTSLEDIEHLRYDVTNVGYFLGRTGHVCIVGVGAGRDVQSAILFGHKQITGIEINPIFIDLLQNDFLDFANIGNREDVILIVGDARSYLSKTTEKYSVIQMSMMDTWAATGVGAFSLSENALYTVEAWDAILDRLEDYGVFMVSRWHNPENIGETGRVLSLAVISLLNQGVQKPSKHLALIASDNISTLLVTRQPFDKYDVDRLRQVCLDLQFHVIHLPGNPPSLQILHNIVSAESKAQLDIATAKGNLNYDPPTDENPYFFNMLRLSRIGAAFRPETGVVRGNLLATLTLLTLLLALSVVAVVTIVLPLALRTRFDLTTKASPKLFWAGASYFSLIGCAFMFLEIALIQRLTVFLGHPIYALGILLFTLIASTGLGSFLSDGLPLTRSPWLFLYPTITTIAVICVRFLLALILPNMVTVPIVTKILVSVVIIFPLGILMGMFFPTGMRLVRSACASETPWYWALNGIFSVLCSALAVFIAIYSGISTNLYIAAFLYGSVLISVFILNGSKVREI
ncbi:MAG: hypothetical protein JSV33_15145 [bacterium]|nr:MAG: hypothetical protein JSV33_15145 [bacterium]